MALFDPVRGFITTLIYGAGSVNGEKDENGNVRVYGILGQGTNPYLGVIKKDGKTIFYTRADGKEVRRPILE